MSERILFYPWLRQGWAGAALPSDEPSSNLASRVVLPVELNVNASRQVRKNVALLGPGDVVGIDRRQVIRTDPAPSSRAFEPNFLACVDFDRPDFPWLFTPAAANSQNRLRPWLCLVVVKRQQDVTLTVDPSRPLPVLSIGKDANPRLELPNLADSWGWAHAQVAAFDSTLEAALQVNPERSLSRLICPRRLEPSAGYYACVVPAFEAGRLAGLGLPLTDDVLGTLAPAWNVDDPLLTSILLPVYYSWEFGTGGGGDFASLAKLLHPRPLDSKTGTADLDVGDAGEGLPVIPDSSPDRILRLEGALLAPDTVRKGFTTEDGTAFQKQLSALVAQPSSPDDDPIVGPPLYGDRHASVTTLPPPNTPPNWLRDLNVDPRTRVVSALGRKVIQEHQDQILSSIWQQSGEIARANTIRRNAQFAKVVSDAALKSRFDTMATETLLQMTRPVQGRLPDGAATLRMSMDAHTLARSVAGTAFRRALSPRGRIVRQLLPPPARTVFRTFSKVSQNLISVHFERPQGGLVTLEGVESSYRSAGGVRPVGELVSFQTWLTTDVTALPKLPDFTVRTPEPLLPPNTLQQPMPVPGPTDSFSAGRLRAASAAHQPRLHVPPIIVFGPPKALELDTLGQTAIAQLVPATTMGLRLQRVIIQPPGISRQAEDPFDPVLATPELERPMYETLRDLFPRLMLPGLNGIDDNTAAVLVTNARFVESFLIGVNHELGRELLWRGFPARSRVTYFRCFWDRRGQPGQTASSSDVPPIDQWPGAKHLGEIAAGADGQVVVVVRGELTRRYPNAIYYLGRASKVAGTTKLTLGTSELYPMFRGSLGSDVLFFGFALGKDEVKGSASDPGWYFVIQQPPGEPRFGLDAGVSGTEAFIKPEADASRTAQRLLRPPVRVAIHASALLP